MYIYTNTQHRGEQVAAAQHLVAAQHELGSSQSPQDVVNMANASGGFDQPADPQVPRNSACNVTKIAAEMA